ncbi:MULTISPECIES: TetR/AcrR family transcriptional regulator [unclassified Pseudonocardia]|uniref:TetR/AcrR family transcriptional regulator n=1 Tax=unclassified Pseudonocardia TaxID=2619320 RepID=UPI0001FFE9C8|nr:TetR/AcrR family transcriptional regulator [Pseudonocardia sp. Ae707_Ps1]OLM09032.1 transcriptional regulator, TetR family [Pseudonocardia sp. Ae707_Ps1]
MPRGAGRYGEILAAFTRHIARDGYDGTNFGAVAAELGVSKGTIVHHFGTKERILAALHESYMRRRLAEFDLIVERLDAPQEQLAAVLHAFMRYQVEDRTATVAFQREIARLADEPAMADGRALRERYLARVRCLVEAGVASGVFRPVDPGIDALLMFGSAQWAWTWFTPDGNRSIDEIGTAFVDLALGGLLVDRDGLAELSASDGHAAQVMHEAIRDAVVPEPAVRAS